MDFDTDPEDNDYVPGKASDNEESEKEGAEEMINDIFGQSDEEEFEGFHEADLAVNSRKERKSNFEDEDGGRPEHNSSLPNLSSDDEGVRDEDGSERHEKVWDFEVMLEKKKAETSKKRKRRGDVDIVNDADDIIEEMSKMMKEAVEKDRELNRQKKPAITVMQKLAYVKDQLKKVDLHQAFMESEILSVLTEWLAPLPSNCLPHLEIRETLLKQLTELPVIGTETLKASGLGKAVMYLLKHPKETAKNKQLCSKLINEWARPIFNQTSDYKGLTKEEREQRDYERYPKKRKLSLDEEGSDAKSANEEEKALRPGDPGYVYRARVPAPSIKDYVIRPKWSVEEKPRSNPKKKLNKFSKLQRSMMEKKRESRIGSAVPISIEGRNMSL